MDCLDTIFLTNLDNRLNIKIGSYRRDFCVEEKGSAAGAVSITF
jgi:hypothetical protein